MRARWRRAVGRGHSLDDTVLYSDSTELYCPVYAAGGSVAEAQLLRWRRYADCGAAVFCGYLALGATLQELPGYLIGRSAPVRRCRSRGWARVRSPPRGPAVRPGRPEIAGRSRPVVIGPAPGSPWLPRWVICSRPTSVCCWWPRVMGAGRGGTVFRPRCPGCSPERRPGVVAGSPGGSAVHVGRVGARAAARRAGHAAVGRPRCGGWWPPCRWCPRCWWPPPARRYGQRTWRGPHAGRGWVAGGSWCPGESGCPDSARAGRPTVTARWTALLVLYLGGQAWRRESVALTVTRRPSCSPARSAAH